MNQQILIINAGSSSIKYSLFNVLDAQIIAEGLCERIGIDGNFVIKFNAKKIEKLADFSNHQKALKYLFDFLEQTKIIVSKESIIGVGHRIVQGGKYFKDSEIIYQKELQKIIDYIPLAPLHNDPEAKIISEIMKFLPHATNVGVFDTSFHQSIPAENKTYAINKELAKKLQIQRYGFHGTSYKYITLKMQDILKKNNVNLIICHLGNGASIAAVEKNLSINTSMGLTPLEGLVMGTRSGNIDPGIISYMSKQLNLNANQIDLILNKESGLLGLSKSSDMRDIIAKADANNKDAQLALKMFCKRVVEYIVCYANDLKNNVDAIVFTAGIGENAARVRADVCSLSHIIKLEIDQKINDLKIGAYQLISTSNSQIPIYVVRTNEELMIFNDVKKLLKI